MLSFQRKLYFFTFFFRVKEAGWEADFVLAIYHECDKKDITFSKVVGGKVQKIDKVEKPSE